jgi:selenocysteine-specific elongation factor
VRVLGTQEVQPGDEAFLQLMLQRPVVALRGDRFIIRRPSPAETIGGGQVVDPHPARRHRRFNSERLGALEQLLMGTPEDILLQTAQKLGPTALETVVTSSGLEDDLAQEAVNALIDQGSLVLFNNGRMVMLQSTLARVQDEITAKLSDFHQQFPLQPGMPRERLRSQIALDPKAFDSIINRLAQDGALVEDGADLHLSQHTIRFSAEQQARIDALLREFDAQPYSPPSYKQSSEGVGEDLLAALIATGRLIRVSEDVLLQPHVFDEMRQAVISHIQQQGGITLGELRDQFDTSRKYAVAVLEHLDQSGVTVRRGDARVLARK